MAAMTDANKSHFTVDTRYHSVPNSPHGMDQAPEIHGLQDKTSGLNLGDHPQLASKRRWLTTLGIQLFSLCWLVPITALIVLNVMEYVIGASAWCLGGKCFVEAYSPDTAIPENRIHKFDREGHNLLGVLQLVAKALEVWFNVIAVLLVYLVTMRLAGQKEGLPVAYLMRPIEFADPISVADPLLWTSLPNKSTRGFASRLPRVRIWAFVFMTIFLCILSNLMGPATAVLVIPSLQWIDTAKVGNQTFSLLNSGNPPSMDGFAYSDNWYCLYDDMESHRYSCNAYDWADKLDSWMGSTATSQAEGSNTITEQDRLFFQVNNTRPNANGDYHGLLYWVPSRQLVSTFSTDAYNIMYMAQGHNASYMGLTQEEYDSYIPYNRSLQLQLQRNGHILGAYPSYWIDYPGYSSWTTTVDDSRALQCFPYYSYGYDQQSNYTRCIQDGTGWGSNTKYGSFSIEGIYNATTDTLMPAVTAEVFSSDRVALLPNGTVPDGVSADCLINGTVPSSANCNWDSLFQAPQDMENATYYGNTVVFTVSNGTYRAKYAVDFIAYMGFTTYTLKPSSLDNPLLLVQTQDLPTNSSAQPVDPAWTLAAWSVDAGGVVPNNRTLAVFMHNVMSKILNDPSGGWENEVYNTWNAATYVPVFQTLSVIEYFYANVTEQETTSGSNDPDHPLLYRTALMYVWAYGMGSRTAILGVVVALLGVCVVLTQFVLGIVDRRRYRSPMQLLVAALEHSPQDEFRGKEHNEKEMARVRFHVRDAEYTAGKFTFYSKSEEGE